MIEIKQIEQGLWKSSHLHFRDDGPVSKGAKTRQFSVFSSSNRALLGYVKWFSHWRKYCFYPLNSLFDDQCLEQIVAFIKDATFFHKSRLPHIKRDRDKEKERRKKRIEQLTKKKESVKIGLEIEKEGSDIPIDKMSVVEGCQADFDAPEVQEKYGLFGSIGSSDCNCLERS